MFASFIERRDNVGKIAFVSPAPFSSETSGDNIGDHRISGAVNAQLIGSFDSSRETEKRCCAARVSKDHPQLVQNVFDSQP